MTVFTYPRRRRRRKIRGRRRKRRKIKRRKRRIENYIDRSRERIYEKS